MEGVHCKPYDGILIPTTTGLYKPLTQVTHTSGLAGCTEALHLLMAMVACNVPIMDVMQHVAASSCAPPLSTSPPFHASYHPSLHPFFVILPPPLHSRYICVE